MALNTNNSIFEIKGLELNCSNDSKNPSSLINCTFNKINSTPWYFDTYIVVPSLIGIGIASITIYAVSNFYYSYTANAATTLAAQSSDDSSDISLLSPIAKRSFRFSEEKSFSKTPEKFSPTPITEDFKARNLQEVSEAFESKFTTEISQFIEKNFPELLENDKLLITINEFRHVTENQKLFGKMLGFYKRVSEGKLDYLLTQITKDNLKADIKLIKEFSKPTSKTLSDTFNSKAYAAFLIILARIKLTGAEDSEDYLYKNNQEVINLAETFDKSMKKCATITGQTDESDEENVSSAQEVCFQEIEKQAAEREEKIVTVNFSNPQTNTLISVTVDTSVNKCIELHLDNQNITLGVSKSDSDQILIENLTGKTLDEFDFCQDAWYTT